MSDPNDTTTWDLSFQGVWSASTDNARAAVQTHEFTSAPVEYSWKVTSTADVAPLAEALGAAHRALSASAPGAVVLSPREVAALRAIIERADISELTEWLWKKVK